jgi:hypothetical protein
MLPPCHSGYRFGIEEAHAAILARGSRLVLTAITCRHPRAVRRHGRASQIRMQLPSNWFSFTQTTSSPVAIALPSGETATLRTPVRCPLSFFRRRPLGICQTLATRSGPYDRSVPPVTPNLPSGEKAIDSILPRCPWNGRLPNIMIERRVKDLRAVFQFSCTCKSTDQ